MGPLNNILQTSAIEILHSIFSVLVLNVEESAQVEAVVTRKLFIAVQTDRCDLHGPLLHLLHTLVYATISKSQSTGHELPSTGENDRDGSMQEQQVLMSPLLLHTLEDGLRCSFMSRTYRHWLDFLLVTVPLFRPLHQEHISELIQSLSSQIHLAVQELEESWPLDGNKRPISFRVNELDLLALLNTLEKLTLLLISWPTRRPPGVSSHTSPDRVPEAGGLLGMVSSVFTTETRLRETSNPGNVSEDMRADDQPDQTTERAPFPPRSPHLYQIRISYLEGCGGAVKG